MTEMMKQYRRILKLSNKYTTYAQECIRKYECAEDRTGRYKNDPNESSRNENIQY